MSPDRLTGGRLQRLGATYGAGGVLMGAVNLLVLTSLRGQYPTVSPAYLKVCVSPLIAGVQEPVTSKLLPALVFLAWMGRRGDSDWLRANPGRIGALGGFVIGALEFGAKVVDAGALDPKTLPPVLLHVLTGLVVGWAVFRTAGRGRDLVDAHLVLLGVAAAVLVHVGWNRYLGVWALAGTPC
jgi:hypothetical protein